MALKGGRRRAIGLTFRDLRQRLVAAGQAAEKVVCCETEKVC
jgi:hypothetical protein